MSGRAQLDAELARLARMLPPWLAHLRHPAQFWPQFDALARAILARAGPGERRYVRRRLQALLEAHAYALPRGGPPAVPGAHARRGPRAHGRMRRIG